MSESFFFNCNESEQRAPTFFYNNFISAPVIISIPHEMYFVLYVPEDLLLDALERIGVNTCEKTRERESESPQDNRVTRRFA